MRHRRRLLVATMMAAAVTAGCGSDPVPSAATAGPGAARAAPTAPPPAPPPSAATPSQSIFPLPAASSEAPPTGTATLAFAGDTHFEQATPGDDLGSAFSVLAQADAGFVNLETAITDGGEAAPKEYTFRAPASALSALAAAGVDAATLANNHGMDFGQSGLADTLAAEAASGFPLIGVGANEDEAYAPWRGTLNGIHVSVLAATDVLDSFAIDTWPALPDRAGLASSKDAGGDRLVAAVQAESQAADIVAVILHWGVEREGCPTERQQELAAQLAGAGADIIVGSHAHVLEPDAMVGTSYVHYGLGNFLWYSGDGASTGVVTVTVDVNGVTGTEWHPAVVTGGLPQLADGDQKASMQQEFDTLCGG